MPTRAHLHRLSNVWLGNPLYFITQCTAGRRKILADNEVAAFIRKTLLEADAVHGWVAGRFVIMPDHVHFFARPRPGAKELSIFMRDRKRWTARSILDAKNLPAPLWQAEFFDHVLRSAASYAEKWEYVRLNPVRAGLSVRPEDWPHAGGDQFTHVLKTKKAGFGDPALHRSIFSAVTPTLSRSRRSGGRR